jgi:hypothetical protein
MKQYRIILIIVLAVILVGSIFYVVTSRKSGPVDNRGLQDPKSVAVNSATFSVLLHGNGNIYSYYGDQVQEGKTSNLSDGSFQKALAEAKDKYQGDLNVLVKPAADAVYSQTVNLLDQMSINKIENYSKVEMTDYEKKIVDSVFK